MLKNYFKVAVRNLARHKLFSFINIFGLALSMSVCLLVLMRLKDQLSYDKFHPFPERTYRITTKVTDKQGSEFKLATTPLPLASTLVKDYNIVETAVRLYPINAQKASASGKELNISTVFADESFFDVFGFTLQSGKRKTVLNAPNSLVLSNEAAIRYFGNEDPIGKIMAFEKLGNFLVTAVLDKKIRKSHIDFDAFISMSSVPALEKSGKLTPIIDQWNIGTASYTYVVLKKEISQSQLLKAVAQVSDQLMKNTKTQGKEGFAFRVQQFDDIILGEDLHFGMGNIGSRGKSMAEIGISFILLLSACFNYTNLSLARSLKRGKEVGIRKVAGAFRFQIFYQFIIESIFIALLSLGLAYLLLKLIIDYAPFSGEMVPRGATIDLSLFSWFFIFSIFTGLLAGTLPAWALSSFRPVEVLKNLSNIKLFGSNGLRKVLIVLQFTLSLVIIIFTVTFFRQFDYMATGDPGFNAKNIVNIPLHQSDARILRQQISRLNGVENISAASTNLGRNASGTVMIRQPNIKQSINMDYYDVDQNFITNMRLQLVAGQSFVETSSDKESQVVISESARKILQFKTADEAVGQSIQMNDSITVTISGVIKDFYHRGLETPYVPLVLRNREEMFKNLHVKAVNAKDKNLVAAIEKIWTALYPSTPFESSWLYDDLHERKSAWSTVSMLGFLAIITITLACLGLLGMVVYHTETRKKEIGIRKVMGASVPAIMSLLSKNFMRLVIIAGLIALPISYALSYFFLTMFANRINIGFGMLGLCFIGMLLISLVTIGSHIYKVAISNPVNALRSE
jgi:putative ABC transport system permease protein